MYDAEVEQAAAGALRSISEMAAQTGGAPVGMRPSAYTSLALLEMEFETIFKHAWICVGRSDELPNPGDYFTTEVGIVPVLVVRQKSGEIAARVNVCSHRMARVASGKGNAKQFVCPYHGWGYGLDGTLLRAVRMPDTFDKSSRGLRPVQVEIWNGYIWLNIDQDAAPISESLKPITEALKPYHVERMSTLARGREVWHANWKLMVENFLESYHLEMTHAATLSPFFPSDTQQSAVESDRFSVHTLKLEEEGVLPLDDAIAIPNPDLTEADKRKLYVGTIFPSMLFTVAYDQISWIRLQPLAVDKTLIDWGVGGAFSFPRGTRPDPAHPNLYYMNVVPVVNGEDRAVCEAVQIGARSGMVAPATLHPNEAPLLQFARYLAERLGAVST